MKTFWHLVKRFFGSLKQKTVSEEDLLWVENILSQEEMHLWQTMPENDVSLNRGGTTNRNT